MTVRELIDKLEDLDEDDYGVEKGPEFSRFADEHHREIQEIVIDDGSSRIYFGI